jgi:hypothetical protein
MTTRVVRGEPLDAAIEARRSIASYATYREAVEAVDLLADRGFPVERVSIVGHGLKLVEQVTGRLGYLEAALRGAFGGAVVGVLIGWLFGAFDWFNPVVTSAWLALDGLWFGALAGAAVGLLQRALTRGSRDFVSINGLTAERYELLADAAVAEEAQALLDQRVLTEATEGAI